jgi:MoaA/NifB/PqqE/SkfB family radical SAM enzyme
MSESKNHQQSNVQTHKQRELELLQSTSIFDVELSARCNLSCIMCPRKKLKRQLKIMSLGSIKVLIDWLPNNAQAMLCGLGEPLLNNHIFFLIASLKKRGIVVGITTNGLLLTENNIDTLINIGVDLIQVSLNGSTEEIYNTIMRNGSFETVNKNLRYLAKNKTASLTVKLTVTVQDQNKNDIKNIQVMAAEFGLGVFLRKQHSRAGAISSGSPQVVHSSGCGIFPKVTFIAANGDVLSCCQDLAGEFVLGNINCNKFASILDRKKCIIDQGHWFPICKYCDDEYRHLLLAYDIV